MVSIITVCYNSATELKETLDSVLTQTYSDIEYVVVDGGSKDNTVSLLEEYAQKFEVKGCSFRWISERDKGTYDAMNKGAAMANGEWIIYMNAGDSFYQDTALEEFFSKPISDDVDVCYGETYKIMPFGTIITKTEEEKVSNPIMPFIHQSVFVRTKIQREFGFNMQFRILADHDLFYRLRQAGKKFESRQTVISRYNACEGLSASNPLRLNIEKKRIYQYDQKWYWPFVLLKCYFRYGWIIPYQKLAPKWFQAWRMKSKMPRLS